MIELTCVNTGSKHGNCYVVEANGHLLLLDCGCTYKEIMRAIDYRVADIDGILLTHVHGDHCYGLKNLKDKLVNVYTNKETAEALGCIEIPEKKRSQIGVFTVVPFYVPHTSQNAETGEIEGCANYAFLIFLPDGNKLLYATDFSFMPYTFKKQNITHWLIECNHEDIDLDTTAVNYKHVVKGHSSLKAVKDILTENYSDETRSVTICHMNQFADSAKMVSEIAALYENDIAVDYARPGTRYLL